MCLAKLKWKLKKWFALQRAKKEEKVHLPTKEEVLKEERQFEKEALSMKPLILNILWLVMNIQNLLI